VKSIGHFLQAEIGRSSLPHQTDEQSARIEAVLADIWARNVMDARRSALVVRILLSGLTAGAFNFLALPKRLLRRSPELALAACVATLLADHIEAWKAFVVASLVFLQGPIIQSLRLLFFDVADLCTFGALTQNRARTHLRAGPPRRFVPNSDPLLAHLFTTRLLLEDEGKSELDAAGRCLSSREKSWACKADAIEKYWTIGRDTDDYWHGALDTQVSP